MVIRPARFGDFEQIFQMYMRGYIEANEDPNFGDVNRLKKPDRKVMPAWRRGLCRDIKAGNLVYTVACEGRDVLGFCFVKKVDIPDSELSHVGNLGIRVVKEMRGRGIGTALLKDMIRRCRGRFEIIDLQVMSINKAAEKLYKRHGFRRWGTAPGYVKRNGRHIDQYHLALRL